MINAVLSLLLLTGQGEVATAAEAEPSSKKGSINGRIVDNVHQTLPGASIYIEKLKMGAVSDINGFYTLSNIDPGVYDVKVTYVGFDPIEAEVSIKEGETMEYDIVMHEGVELQQVEIKGAFRGQKRAINMQKNAIGVKNVVSADQVGKFPDSNIGDALKRINGINVQYDMGEARFGQVRGTSADLTSVTMNGNRIPSAEGETRNVQLDLIPADMVQTIEVNKVVTSDMDGDAIGGAINLVTKNTPYKRVLNATVGTGYNAVSGKPQINLGLTYGDRYFNDHLGMMIAASFQNAPGGADNREYEYDIDDDGTVYLDKAQIRQYYVTRERHSYSLATDYKFNASNKISFKGMYNRRSDWENRYRVTYKKLNSAPSKQSIVMQTKGGSDDERNARLELQQTMDFTLDGEHSFGALNMDWAGSFSRATEDRPNERYFGIEMKGKKNEEYFNGLSFVDAGGRDPYPNLSIESIDNYNWGIDELTNSDQTIAENEWKARINFNMPLAKGLFGNSMRFGAKYVNKSKEKEIHCFDYINYYENNNSDAWKGYIKNDVRNDFMGNGNIPKNVPFVDKEYLGNMTMNPSLPGSYELYEEAAGNFSASECITSAYLRLDHKLGEKWEAVIGLRMEHTALNYKGYNWQVDNIDDEQGRLVPTDEVDNDYTNWLPSALIKYNASDNLKLRTSFTKTLSRPKYASLVPCIHYNVAEEKATFGNANLKPTYSYNFDLSGEYYFENVGLMSAGVFYKDVKDVIVDEKWKSYDDPNIPAGLLNEDGEAVKYEIKKPINAYDANLLGIELAYQRDFGFIAPTLKSVGFYGTYTYTYSSTKNYEFEHRTIDNTEEIKMSGSPTHTANMSLYYEDKGLSMRLSYNYASDFVDEFGTTAQLDRYYDKVNYLDLNAGYTFGSKFKTTIYAEANNLLNQPLRYYQGSEERTMQVEYYGVRFNAGVKFQF